MEKSRETEPPVETILPEDNPIPDYGGGSIHVVDSSGTVKRIKKNPKSVMEAAEQLREDEKPGVE